MKSLLLSIALLLAAFSFGQKRMIEQSTDYYDQNNVFINQYSFVYNYSTWSGLMPPLEPKLVLWANDFDFKLIPTVICDLQEHFVYSPSQPITSIGSIDHTLVNGMITESYEFLSLNNTRTLFTYDSFGRVTDKVIQLESLGIWETMDSVRLSYDATNNILLNEHYGFTSGVPLANYIDSMEYAPGTNNLIFYQRLYDPQFQYTGTRSEITYLGDNIDHVDVYEINDFGDVIWTTRLIYQYVGSTLVETNLYDVISNVPSTTIASTRSYSYTSTDQLSEITYSSGGSVNFRQEYSYDTDGYVTSEKSYILPNIGTENRIFERYFYYENVLENEEILNVNVNTFPNPSTDFIEIQTEGKLETVSLFNSNGQLVIEQTGQNLDVRHLEPGTYILKGKTELGTFTEQIIKL